MTRPESVGSMSSRECCCCCIVATATRVGSGASDSFHRVGRVSAADSSSSLMGWVVMKMAGVGLASCRRFMPERVVNRQRVNRGPLESMSVVVAVAVAAGAGAAAAAAVCFCAVKQSVERRSSSEGEDTLLLVAIKPTAGVNVDAMAAFVFIM